MPGMVRICSKCLSSKVVSMQNADSSESNVNC